MTTQQYQQASEHFLTQARRELADGHLPPASEKGWGTTAQILKAAAHHRGWEHSRHRHQLVTVIRLRAETGDGDIPRLFNTASPLHEKIYENAMQAFEVAESLENVAALWGSVGEEFSLEGWLVFLFYLHTQSPTRCRAGHATTDQAGRTPSVIRSMRERL